MPDATLQGFRATPVRYADELALSRALLVALCPPERVCGGWAPGLGQLLGPEAANFWTVHSDRAVLATWGACMGMPKSALDAFGRWAASGSDEYIRSTRNIVTKAQASIAAALRSGAGGPDLIGEGELLA